MCMLLLHRPRERWWSIVMSASVCLSVCLRAYLPNHTHDLYRFFVHVAYCRGSVLLRRGDAMPSGRGNFGGFLSDWQCIVQPKHSGPIRKRLNRSRCRLTLMTRVGHRYHLLDGDPIPKGKGHFLGENVVVHWKVMGQSAVSCAKTAKLIEIPFWNKTLVGRRNHV